MLLSPSPVDLGDSALSAWTKAEHAGQEACRKKGLCSNLGHRARRIPILWNLIHDFCHKIIRVGIKDCLSSTTLER